MTVRENLKEWFGLTLQYRRIPKSDRSICWSRITARMAACRLIYATWRKGLRFLSSISTLAPRFKLRFRARSYACLLEQPGLHLWSRRCTPSLETLRATLRSSCSTARGITKIFWERISWALGANSWTDSLSRPTLCHAYLVSRARGLRMGWCSRPSTRRQGEYYLHVWSSPYVQCIVWTSRRKGGVRTFEGDGDTRPNKFTSFK